MGLEYITRNTVESGMIRAHGRLPFALRAEDYSKKNYIQAIVVPPLLQQHIERLLKDVGGIEKLTSNDCDTFVRRNKKALEDIGNTDDPAFVYALAKSGHWRH
jgi:hypothetical protein